MIKSELIMLLCQAYQNLPEKDVAESVNLLIQIMSDTLSTGGRIEIRDFGSFSLHYRGPRNAHNPKTGERVLTVEKYRPHFKPGKELRERVNAIMEESHIDEQSTRF